MADQNKYTLPIGVDARDFFAGIASIDKGIDDLSKGVTDANKGMQQAFNQTVASSEKLDKALTSGADAAVKFGQKTEDAARSASTTLDALSIKLRRLQGDLVGNQNILERKQIIQQIEQTKKAIDAETTALQKNAAAQKSVTSQLTATRNEMAKLTVAGKSQSQEYSVLKTRAQDLAKVQKTVGDETKVAADKSGNAFTKSFGLLRQLALFIPGIGIAGIFNLAFEAIGPFILKLFTLKGGLDAVKESARVFGEAINGKEVQQAALNVEILRSNVELANKGLLSQDLVVKQYNETMGKTVGTVKTFAEVEKSLTDNAESYVKATLFKAAANLALEEAAKKALEAEGARLKSLDEFKEAIDRVSVLSGVDRNDPNSAFIQEQDKKRRDKVAEDRRKQVIEQAKKDQKVQEDIAANFIKQAQAESAKFEKQKQTGFGDLTFTDKDASAKQAAAAEKIFREQEAQKKRIAELNKQYDNLQVKSQEESLQKTYDDLASRKKATEELLNIEEEKIRHKEATGKKLTDLDNQELAAIEKIRAQLDKNLTLDKQKALDDFLLKQATLIVKANIEIAEAFGNLEELELEKLREGYKLKLLEYAKQYKDLPGKLKELQEAAVAAQARQEQAIRAKFAREAIDQEEKLQIASLNIAFGFKELPARVEEQKQAAILKVAIAAAKRRLEVELLAGEALNKVGIAQAKEAVAELEGELAKLSGTKKFDNIFDVLGLTGEGGLTPSQIKAIQDGVGAIMQAYKQVTDAILQANQTQIDASTKRIDAFDSEIDKLQEGFDKEEELRGRGLANNSKYYSDQIALQKKAKDDEIKNRQELFEKQKALQRQQLIADTIAQASSLVTASANVIEGFSTIPIVGVPLGIVAVGAMIAGFIAAKVAAFNAINNQQSFGEGGTVDGPSHSRGGKKYRALDGSGVVELEGGEEVVRKSQSEKYRDLIKAINSDSISSMSDESLAALLAGTGVTFKTDIPEQAERASNEYQAAKSAVFIATNGRVDNSDMKAIREDVGYLADRKRNEVETWEDDRFFYERKGNQTFKIKK